MATKAVATKNMEQAVAMFSNDVPEYMKNQTGPGRGNEGVGSEDMVIPRLEIVQSQSPIKDENDEAKEGYLFNSATNEVIGDIAYFVPIMFKKDWIVWKDKDEGGGFFGAFASESEAKARLREKVADGETESFLQIVDTPVHYGLLVDPTGKIPTQQIAISMAKSKAKISRKWNATIQLAGGDRFSRVYKITTFKDKNAKGQSFFNFVVQPAGFAPEAVYNLASQTYEAMRTQGVRTVHENEDGGEGSGDGIDRGGI